MRIGNLDLRRAPALIAEIGNNHEGDAAAARALAERALDCGAHIVKFQLIDPERLVAADQTERVKQLARFRLPTSGSMTGMPDAVAATLRDFTRMPFS